MVVLVIPNVIEQKGTTVKLSPHEAADAAIKAGFSTVRPALDKPSEAEIIVAIGCAESSLDTDALGRSTETNSTDPGSLGQRDHGVWQLSGRWQWDKIMTEKGAWRDPYVNARIARKIFLGQGFEAWAVFKSGSYLAYLPDARHGVAHPFPFTTPDLTALVQLRTSVDALKKSIDMLTSAVNAGNSADAETASVIKTVAGNVSKISSHFV